MIRTRRQTRAFTLLELISILPILATLLAVLAWALVGHLKITRGLADQTHRQEIMQRILRSLRQDALAADAITLESFEPGTTLHDIAADVHELPPTSDAAHRTIAARLTITISSEAIIYDLIAEWPDTPRSENSTLADLPPEYFLVRVANNDDIPTRVWSLLTLQMSFPPADEGPYQESDSVRVVFQSAQHLDARAPIHRTFDTTLRAGGRH